MSSSLMTLEHFMVDEKGNCAIDSLGSRQSKPAHTFKVKGDHVHRSYQQPGNPKNIAVCSKGTCLQLWDVAKRDLIWQAKNVPNDHLDL